MRFSEILDSMESDGGGHTATVPDSWLQGRSVYGGLQAALAVRAMRGHAPDEFALRVLQTTFVAPVPPGRVRVESRLLRAGKSAAHVEARLLLGAETAALAVGVFGAKRASRIAVAPERPSVDAPGAFDFRYVPDVSPMFTQHFAIRWLKGGLPFTATNTAEAFAELRMPGEGTATVEHVIALADVMPPVAFSYLDARARGSSATWTLEMLTDAVPALGAGAFRADATLVAARDGYTSQSVLMWGPGGEPVALSRQSMFVFG